MSKHVCEFAWCRADRECDEHYGEATITSDAGILLDCFAWVDRTGDHDDEIWLSIQRDRSEDGRGISLTDDQARKLRDLIDVALANRAEARQAVTR